MKITKTKQPVMASWIYEEGCRLDAHPFLSGAVEARNILAKLTVKKDRLDSVTQDGGEGIVHAGRIPRIWVSDPEFGTPFLSGRDVQLADLSHLRFISNKVVEENPSLTINDKWILITRSGTIGRTVYSRSEMRGMACTEDVLRVIPGSQIDGGYLYAFLISKFGIPIVIAGTYGSIIRHLEPEHICDLPVPRLATTTENRVGSLVDESSRLLSEFQSLICEATRAFFDSVGLEDITSTQWHSWGPDVGFAAVHPDASSLRALNYNPRFHRLCSRLKDCVHLPLRDVCNADSLQRGNRFTRIDASPEHSYRLIGQKQLFWLRPEGRWVAKFSLPDDAIVSNGTILMAVQGTLGETEMYCRAEYATGPAT
ncbi:MAG: hypothetical protein KDB27_34060, partial [Planctomycetales bacterium]|nr:hypothetical protein [Planctomycetales bacterium]